MNKSAEFKTLLWLALAVYGGIHLLFFGLPDLFATWDERAIDRLFRYRNRLECWRPAYLDTIVHLDLNNTSIQALQTYFPDRSYHARVIDNLAAMGVGVQFFDTIFTTRRSPEEDRALVEAVASAGNVYLGLAFELISGDYPDRPGPATSPALAQYLAKTSWKLDVSPEKTAMLRGLRPLASFPELNAASAGTGFLNLAADNDGTFRRVPLLVRYAEAWYPSLALRVICDYLAVPPDRIRVQPGKRITLAGACLPGQDRKTAIHIPVDSVGRMIVNFIGPWERMTHYNYVDVLHASRDRDEMELWAEELSGKIVIISEVTTGSADIGPAPTDARFPLSGVHANAMHTILSGDFLRELPPLGRLLSEWLLLGVVLAAALFFSPLRFALAASGLAPAFVAAWAGLFLFAGVIAPLVRPLMITGGTIVAVAVYRYMQEERSKALLRAAFEAYFPPGVVGRLIRNPALLLSHGQKKELSVLFSDIVNFTGNTARMDPADAQAALNLYFDEMTAIVFEHGGTVDKFIGDGLLAFFGDPTPQKDHAERCVAAAVEMQQRVLQKTKAWEAQTGVPIRIRIGINTGTMIVGNMGSAKRLSYTVIGSAVNLAQRLESHAPAGGILISRATRDQLADNVAVVSRGALDVKGFDRPVEVYEVKIDNSGCLKSGLRQNQI